MTVNFPISYVGTPYTKLAALAMTSLFIFR